MIKDIKVDDFTILEENKFLGDNKLGIIKEIGTKAAMTDFSILLGGYCTDQFYTNNSKSLSDRLGSYWTKTPVISIKVRVMNFLGETVDININGCNVIGIRPALTFSSLENLPTNKISQSKYNGVLEVEYGYYPQTATSKYMQELLEANYQEGVLEETGNSYTTDSNPFFRTSTFIEQKHIEYKYNGKRYIRVKANSCYDEDDVFFLSNGESYKNGDFVFVEIQPIKWLVDTKSCTMLTEKIVVAGLEFTNSISYAISEFPNTNVKQFLDKYWAKDIFQVSYQQENMIRKIQKLKKYLNFLDTFEEFEVGIDSTNILQNLQNLNGYMKKQIIEDGKDISQLLISILANDVASKSKVIEDKSFDSLSDEEKFTFFKDVINMSTYLFKQDELSINNKDIGAAYTKR